MPLIVAVLVIIREPLIKFEEITVINGRLCSIQKSREIFMNTVRKLMQYT